MLAVLRRRLEMAVRVRDFLRAHRTEGLQGAEGTALVRLEELITRAEALAAQQQAGLVARRGSTAQRAAVRRGLQSKLLRYLSAVGRIAAQENLELAAEFRIPRTNATNQAFVILVRGMLAKATEHKDLLVGRGMSEQLLDDLNAALVEFEQTLEATRTALRDHVGASSDMKEVVAEIVQQVRMLDGLVRYRFGDNAELMGAWLSARNVPDPVRSHGEPTAPVVVKPAA